MCVRCCTFMVVSRWLTVLLASIELCIWNFGCEGCYKIVWNHSSFAKFKLRCDWFQALATPREMFLKKVPFPLPNPNIFNLDQIVASTKDNVVSENGNLSYIFMSLPPLFLDLLWLKVPTLFILLPWHLQLWLSMILELPLISWKGIRLSIFIHTVKEAHNLVLLSVKESHQILIHEATFGSFFSLCYSLFHAEFKWLQNAQLL